MSAATADRPRTRYRCPICGNDDGAAGIRKRKPEQRGEWDSRWWVECRKCQGKQRNGDYIKALANHIDVSVIELLHSAKKVMRRADLLLPDSNNKASSKEIRYGPPPKPVLDLHKWNSWHEALLERSIYHSMLGGVEVVRSFRLMYIGPEFDRNGRAAIGFPVRRYGRPVNIIRRYFEGEPRYRSAKNGRLALWPDVADMSDYIHPVVLVAGMRDACFALAARLDAYSTTAGAASWPVDDWAEGRRFTLAFDRGEEQPACQLASRLFAKGADSVSILTMPQGVKDLAELGERKGLDELKRFLRG